MYYCTLTHFIFLCLSLFVLKNCGLILPDNPLDQDSKWRCVIHKSIEMESKLTQQLAIDLQIDLYSGGLITTIKNLEKKIEQLLEFLHPTHGLLLAAKRSLVHCYSQVPSIGNLKANQRQQAYFFFLLFLREIICT